MTVGEADDRGAEKETLIDHSLDQYIDELDYYFMNQHLNK